MGLHREQPLALPLYRLTSDLHGRVWEHKNGVFEGFSKKYKTHYLVYEEFFYDIESAIAREKQLKGWS